MTSPSLQSPRTTVKRLARRGAYDRDTVYSILDAGLFCHIAFLAGGEPRALPTAYGRIDDRLYVHGSPASAMLRSLQQPIDVCVTVTLLDGLVFARSAFHHSMNYRCAVVIGRAEPVTAVADKLAALRAIVDHVSPGRWEHTRAPNERELKQTCVLALPLAEASAKVRTGPPVDDEPDYALPHWAGELPLRVVPGAPVPDPRLPADVAIPPGVAGYAVRSHAEP